MNSNLTRRIVLVFAGTLFVAFGLFVLGVAWEFIHLRDFSIGGMALLVDPSSITAQDRLIWSVYSGVSLLTGIAAFFLAWHQEGTPAAFLIQDIQHPSGVGDLRVTLRKRGLLSLITYLAESVEGVGEAQTNIELEDDGWDLDIVLFLDTTAVVPEVVDRVRHALRTSVERQTGIQLDDLNLDVELVRRPRTARVN